VSGGRIAAAEWVTRGHHWAVVAGGVNWRRKVYQPIARQAGLPQPRPHDLRGSYVSLLAAAGYTLLEVSRRAGHSVVTCERYYAKIFDDIYPAKRVDPEDQIRAAREPGVGGVERLFDVG
jgi:integrase